MGVLAAARGVSKDRQGLPSCLPIILAAAKVLPLWSLGASEKSLAPFSLHLPI